MLPIRLLAVVATAISVWTGGAATASPTSSADPCTISWTDDGAPESDPDVDIQQVVYHLGVRALHVTIHVADLSDHPQVGTGHRFYIDWAYRVHQPYRTFETAYASYSHDEVAGDRNYEPNSSLWTLRDTRATFDTDNDVVVITLPRSALYAQMVHPDLEPTLFSASAGSTTQSDGQDTENAAAADFTFYEGSDGLSFAACDRALGVQPRPVQLDPRVDHVFYPDACTTVVTDPTGDGRTVNYDTGEATARPDLDMTRTVFRLRAHRVDISARVPQMGSHPDGYWQQEFTVHFVEGDDDDPEWSESGYQRGTAGEGPTGDGPQPEFRLDDSRGRIDVSFGRDDAMDSTGSSLSFTTSGDTPAGALWDFRARACDRLLS